MASLGNSVEKPLRKLTSFRGNSIGTGTNVALNVVFILISVAFLYPFLLIIGISLSDNHYVMLNGYSLIPKQFTTYAYKYLFTNMGGVLHAYQVTIIITVVGTVSSVFLMALTAYPLSRKEFRYRSIFSFIIYFTMLFNGGLVPTYIVRTQLLGLRNNLWALILPFLFNSFFIIIMRTFMLTSVPTDLYDSAKIDGAGEWGIFLRIVIPLSKPVLATVALFQALLYWNDWFTARLYINTAEFYPLQYLMYVVQNDVQYIANNPYLRESGIGALPLPQFTLRMAMVVVGVGPIVFAYPFFQRFFVKGMTIGALKG